MNNRTVLNNLKSKNSIKQNVQKKNSMQHEINQYSSNGKYNPDVRNNYSNREDTINTSNYEYSPEMWKPIIGSIEKSKITKDDLVVEIDKPNTEKIMSDYDQRIDELKNEKKLVEQKIKQYAIEHPILNDDPNMKEINKPIEVDSTIIKNITSIDDTFIELKKTSHDIIKNTDNIDPNLIDESVIRLDKLLNDIKNL
jgi:hypothetical protein